MMNDNLLQQDRLCLEEIDQFINFNSILFLFGGTNQDGCPLALNRTVGDWFFLSLHNTLD